MDLEFFRLIFLSSFLILLQGSDQARLPLFLLLVVEPVFGFFVVLLLQLQVFVEGLPEDDLDPVGHGEGKRLPQQMVDFPSECEGADAPDRIVAILMHEQVAISVFLQGPAFGRDPDIHFD